MATMRLAGCVLLLCASSRACGLEVRPTADGGGYGTADVLRTAFFEQSNSELHQVGSTTMRQVLSARASKHNWHTYPGSQGMCTAKPLNLSLATLPQCSDVERSNVVQTDFGYCSLLNGARSCKYMTLVREPLDMMVSRYNYYCLACAENGTECPGFAGDGQVNSDVRDRILRIRQSSFDPRLSSRPVLSCPDMSLVDYARYAGNIYTGMFSGRKTLCDQEFFPDISTGNEAYMACRNTVHTEDFRKALAFPLNAENLVLRLESLYTDNRPNGMDQLAAFLHEDDMAPSAQTVLRNKNRHQYTPSLHEKEELRSILIYDVLLYAASVEQRG